MNVEHRYALRLGYGECQTMLWHLLRFLKIDEYFYPFRHYLVFDREHFLSEMLPLPLGKKRLHFINLKWQ